MAVVNFSILLKYKFTNVGPPAPYVTIHLGRAPLLPLPKGELAVHPRPDHTKVAVSVGYVVAHQCDCVCVILGVGGGKGGRSRTGLKGVKVGNRKGPA